MKRLLVLAKKNPRSEFLSNLMKEISGSQGEKIIDSFFGPSVEAFTSAMSELAQSLANKMPNKEEK